VLILKIVKVLCFDTLLEVLIPVELREILWDALVPLGGGMARRAS
jgi:hypothetical protein